MEEGYAGSSKLEAPPAWWRRTSILTVIIFAAVLLNNAQFIFQTQHYELNDFAANSLQVLEAKRFHEVLGHYCRFEFHHPGPAFFYVYAFGEALFYDATHLVPTPFNGQIVALYALSVFFFSATLSLIARRIGRAEGRWFLGLSLLLAAWHFGAVGRFYEFIPGHLGLFCIWPPCVLVLPFLCFLAAVASVASGNGRDLPLMALAGCFLVHGYVSMPLFVVPLALLAYGGLIHHARIAGPRGARWPWRAFARQHWLAGAIIVVFLIPIVIDMVTTHPNNIQLIIEHIQSGYGERKGVLRSLLYFLHFGAYAAYPNSNPIPAFETFDLSGTILFFRTHWRAYGLWLTSFLLPLAILLGRTRRLASTDRDPAYPSADFKGLLFWMYIVLGAAFFLSMVWGYILEGPMYYYVSFFYFAIYYGFLLIFAIVAALWMEDRISPRLLPPSYAGNWRSRVAALGPILVVVAAVAAFAHEARRFRSVPPDQNQQRLFATSLERALRIDPAQPKFLSFEDGAWAEAVGVALYLERSGCSWAVRKDWPFVFGRERVITDKRPGPPFPTPSSSFWQIVSSKSSPSLVANDRRLHALSLTNGIDLVVQPAGRNGAQIEK